MEAVPQAALILAPAQQALGFFMKLFNPVAAMRVFDHDTQRRVKWKIAPEILPLAIVTCWPLTDQLADLAGARPPRTATNLARSQPWLCPHASGGSAIANAACSPARHRHAPSPQWLDATRSH